MKLKVLISLYTLINRKRDVYIEDMFSNMFQSNGVPDDERVLSSECTMTLSKTTEL